MFQNIIDKNQDQVTEDPLSKIDQVDEEDYSTNQKKTSNQNKLDSVLQSDVDEPTKINQKMIMSGDTF